MDLEAEIWTVNSKWIIFYTFHSYFWFWNTCIGLINSNFSGLETTKLGRTWWPDSVEKKPQRLLFRTKKSPAARSCPGHSTVFILLQAVLSILPIFPIQKLLFLAFTWFCLNCYLSKFLKKIWCGVSLNPKKYIFDHKKSK